MSEFSEFFEASVRAEWQDWTFGAHQATTRAAAAEELIALRRQYDEMSEQDLVRLAASWRQDDSSSAYFAFAAAEGIAVTGGADGSGRSDSDMVAVSATFLRALLHELGDEAPSALASLLDQWAEQRRRAREAGMRPTPVRRPRVSVLLPRDKTRWPPQSWRALIELDLDAPRFDNTLLYWDAGSDRWTPTGTPA